MKKVLAIDMGATSIRGIIGYIENDTLITKEVMRMAHKIVSEDGFMRWQFNELLEKIVGKYDNRGKNTIGFTERFKFYEDAKSSYLIIATSEKALYANIMLQKGVVVD